MKKRSWITIAIILGVIIISIIIINRGNGASQSTTECIGQNAELYVQLGCHACKIQEEMFGEHAQDLNIIDCWYEKDKCSDIQYTPTWIINREKYIGVQSIEELKELTGCD